MSNQRDVVGEARPSITEPETVLPKSFALVARWHRRKWNRGCAGFQVPVGGGAASPRVKAPADCGFLRAGITPAAFEQPYACSAARGGKPRIRQLFGPRGSHSNQCGMQAGSQNGRWIRWATPAPARDRYTPANVFAGGGRPVRLAWARSTQDGGSVCRAVPRNGSVLHTFGTTRTNTWANCRTAPVLP